VAESCQVRGPGPVCKIPASSTRIFSGPPFSIGWSPPALLIINNRLEGHAPSTAEAVADRLLG
jgi:hypothetical protein